MCAKLLELLNGLRIVYGRVAASIAAAHAALAATAFSPAATCLCRRLRRRRRLCARRPVA